MPTIKARKQASGSTRYTAVVRLRRGTTVLHQESRTFTHRTAALSWAKHREVALEDPAELTRKQHSTPTLAELIRWYIETFETISRWQRSKQTHLEFLERHSLGKTIAHTLTSADLIRHVQSRRAEGAGPATVINDLIWVGVVLRAAKSVKELPVAPEIVQQARSACRELRLVGKPKKRTRRPTADELTQLREHFKSRDRRAEIPMLTVMEFAIASARREAEICRLEWRDNDEPNRTGLVRDAKHPTGKDGNHRRFKYTPEAWALVSAQPETSERIFPYDPKSVGAAFTRACHLLGIQDLRFHDLRHEATSRLFERGYQIHEVAQFTLHESWNELKRYTNLKPENLREIAAPRAKKPRANARKSSRAANQPSGAEHQSAQRDLWH
ncbi:MAG TPA: tyrosine-type recombinase/integrase [Steroidobacteraceae bacterium]|jgi:integrase|nr:tyrosine-type recombinase/integrase [Steroidobacteraceae bacterium]